MADLIKQQKELSDKQAALSKEYTNKMTELKNQQKQIVDTLDKMYIELGKIKASIEKMKI
jgi:uncharacterized protein involved in exopolysaccharide biosynthesis